jgi:hypothetical protein
VSDVCGVTLTGRVRSGVASEVECGARVDPRRDSDTAGQRPSFAVRLVDLEVVAEIALDEEIEG